METATTTLEQFIAKHSHSIKFSCEEVDSRADGIMSDMARHFKCRITGRVFKQTQRTAHSWRSFGLYFSQGSAHTDAPTLADVLDCMASDASGYENAQNFNDWASEYGYDTDSRKAEKIYRTVKRQAEQLKRTLGEEAYNELLWNTERL